MNSTRCDSALSSESCVSADSSNPPVDKTIVDLDVIVEKWIMYMWEKTKTKQQASKYEFEDMEVIVNWSKVDLIQDEAKFEPGSNPFGNRKPNTQTLFRTFSPITQTKNKNIRSRLSE